MIPATLLSLLAAIDMTALLQAVLITACVFGPWAILYLGMYLHHRSVVAKRK